MLNPLRAAALGMVALGDLTIRGVDRGRRMVSMLFNRGYGTGRYFLPRTRFDYQREVDPIGSSIVLACMGWVCRNFPDAPVKITRRGADGAEETIRPAVNGPGRMLQLLERPNDYHSGVLLWQAVLIDFMQGDAYIWKQRAVSNGADPGRVVGLWWLPASAVIPRWDPADPSVFIAYYEYRVDGGMWAIPPGDLIHLRQGIDPFNTRKGRSQLASLFREIFTDDEAANMTASLMRNLGVPGVTIAPANTTNQIIKKPDEVSDKFRARFGGDERGSVMTFSQPTEIKVLSWNPQQMDLKALRRIPEERVSAVLGVPAGVAGLGAGLDRNTFSNYGEARVAAYTEGVIPLQRLIGAELEVQLLPEFTGSDGAWYDVVFDWTQASAMQEAKDAIWTRARAAATVALITRAEFKRMVNLQPAADGSDDVYIYPGNYLIVPAGGDAPGGLQPPQQLPRGQLPAPQALPPRQSLDAVLGPGFTDLPALLPGATAGNGHHAPIGAAP